MASQTPVSEPAATSLPTEIYAIFCGGIEQFTAQKISSGLTGAIAQKAEHVHILFQSSGGFIGDGVYLYNLLRSLPIKSSLYNAGQVSSAAVTAYLGATHRYVSSQATFMIHRGTQNPQPATSRNLRHIGNNLSIDDQRTETILRSHINLSDEIWNTMQYHDVYLSAEEAIDCGMAEAVKDFAPPLGTQVYNLLLG
jgi:ATP-dependent Clp protease, protease subunit